MRVRDRETEKYWLILPITKMSENKIFKNMHGCIENFTIFRTNFKFNGNCVKPLKKSIKHQKIRENYLNKYFIYGKIYYVHVI